MIVDSLINKIVSYPEILEWAHIDWYARYIAAFNFTDSELKVLFALADKFHEEGYTVDNYFIENVGGMTDYGASVGYVTEYSKEIAKGKIQLALTGIEDKDNPYYDDIMIGNVTGGANQQEYITNEYDLHEVYSRQARTEDTTELDDYFIEDINNVKNVYLFGNAKKISDFKMLWKFAMKYNQKIIENQQEKETDIKRN